MERRADKDGPLTNPPDRLFPLPAALQGLRLGAVLRSADCGGLMPLYTFYPYRPDGTSLAFEFAELPSDEAALAHAEIIQEEHRTASRVDVWAGDRRVAAALASSGAAARGPAMPRLEGSLDDAPG